jgi:transposase-like protein
MTEQELARGAARRLAIIRHAQEVTGNVSRTCRYYGITRQAYYNWLRRSEEQDLEGLRDRSRRAGGRLPDRPPLAPLPPPVAAWRSRGVALAAQRAKPFA